MEVSIVRRALNSAIERSKVRAAQRRQEAAQAESSFKEFLEFRAVPLARQLAQILKAEGFPFTVFTPSGGMRLASDHGRDDYIELLLDTSGATPQVVGRVSRVRGSRTLTREEPVRPGVSPAELTEDEVLVFLVEALEPWLER